MWELLLVLYIMGYMIALGILIHHSVVSEKEHVISVKIAGTILGASLSWIYIGLFFNTLKVASEEANTKLSKMNDHAYVTIRYLERANAELLKLREQIKELNKE